MYDFKLNSGFLSAASVDQAQAAGAMPAQIGAAVRAKAALELDSLANGLRNTLASANPGKLQEWDMKAAIAAAPATQFTAERAILSEEAAARGLSLAELLALIQTRASAYRQLALSIAKFEAVTKAALSAVPDLATDLEAQINAIMATARTQAGAIVAAAQST